MAVRTHGASGYSRGCKCETCRAGHRDAMRRWRDARKKAEQADAPPAAPAEPQIDAAVLPPQSLPAIDLTAPAGPIESALAEELEALIGEPPFKKTLIVLARFNARVLDQIPGMDRADLISGIQSRLFNCFDKLRATTVPTGSPATEWSTRELGGLMTGDGS